MARHTVLLITLPLMLAGQAPPPRDLTDYNIEDLMNIQVTSVSKKPQNLSRTGAAVYVITQDDIQHSTATNIPDLLRLVPGVNVAQFDASSWAISIRGFNDRYSNKVLVLIDGRSVYSPEFSGVLWNEQDVPLENIERIEIIRGPGGTVWGANAMNGVINIITKHSKSTAGGLITASGGAHGEVHGLAQYGGAAGRNGSYRAFAHYSNYDPTSTPSGRDAGDGWHFLHGGVRSDFDVSPSDALTVSADLTRTRGSETITTLISSALPLQQTLGTLNAFTAANLTASWRHQSSDESEFSVRAYYSYDEFSVYGLHDLVHTGGADFEHHLSAGSRHDLVWGAGYRLGHDSTSPGYAIRVLPLYPTDHLASAFVQDEITLSPSVSLTIGSKLEHNTYTGIEYEPSAQLVWSRSSRESLWVSGARAIRQPARSDRAVDVDSGITPLPGGQIAITKLIGSAAYKAEEMRDIEAGYRRLVTPRFSFDVATFLNFYSSLATNEPGTPYFAMSPGSPHFVIPIGLANNGHGRGYGGEFFATWNPLRRWRLSPGYSFLQLTLRPDHGTPIQSLQITGAKSPRHQVQLRSALNLARNLDWDTSMSFVSRLPDQGMGSAPAYVRLDTGLKWKVNGSFELGIIGQNLLTPRHIEFPDVYPIHATGMERKVLATVAWRF